MTASDRNFSIRRMHEAMIWANLPLSLLSRISPSEAQMQHRAGSLTWLANLRFFDVRLFLHLREGRCREELTDKNGHFYSLTSVT